MFLAISGVMSAPEAPSFIGVHPTALSLNCGEATGATGDAARRLPQLTKCRRARCASGVTPRLSEDYRAGSASGPTNGPPSVAVTS